MAKPLKKQLGDALLGEERFEAWRARFRKARQARANRPVVFAHAQPGKAFLAHEIMRLTGRDAGWVDETMREYAQSRATWHYLSALRSPSRRTDGITFTLDLAEGFALWSLVKHLRPKVIVELGTQFGISARLWKGALTAYVPKHTLYLCDLTDRRRYIRDDEATFFAEDGEKVFARILANEQVDILYNDAHPYTLIRNTVTLGVEHQVPCFAFHDVGGRALRNFPYFAESAAMTQEERVANSLEFIKYGHWERHVMAEVFDARLTLEEFVENERWRVQIFDSLFGFGVALARTHTLEK